MRLFLLAFLASVLAVAAPAGAAGPAAPLAGQRAVYQLTLEKARGFAISDVSGTMTYDQRGGCDGWATTQELDLRLAHTDGKEGRILSRYATWEAKTGLSMRFRLLQTAAGRTASDIAGSATLARPGGPGEVRYTSPPQRTVPLPAGTLFPTAHTERILAAARAGEKFLSLPLFDGTSANGAQLTSVLILSKRPPAPSQWPSLARLGSERVQIAFFRNDPRGMRPDFAIAMRYWENGVADGLSLDFGDFVLKGKLVSLTLLPSRC